jgi:predicted nucleic acid binding AN1-type Zn finger protein
MDTLDKGKHCSEEYCHQLDYLPMKCSACHRDFCADHFKYEAHNCEQANKIDFKIPVCEICENPIEFKRGKDLDLCLAEHMSKCQLASPKQESQKPKKVCNYKGCKSREVFRFECDVCHLNFCVRHRMPEIHLCDSDKGVSRTCSGEMQRLENQKKSVFSFKKIFSY